jgi:hypothetical protein
MKAIAILALFGLLTFTYSAELCCGADKDCPKLDLISALTYPDVKPCCGTKTCLNAANVSVEKKSICMFNAESGKVNQTENGDVCTYHCNPPKDY